MKIECPNMTLIFDLLISKSIKVLFGSWSMHLWSVIILCQMEMELSCGNGKYSKSKYDLDLWLFDPKLNRDSPRVMVNTSVKYHHCMWKGIRVFVLKWLFSTEIRTDKQTDIQADRAPWWNKYTPGCIKWSIQWCKMTKYIFFQIVCTYSKIHTMWVVTRWSLFQNVMLNALPKYSQL